jgi:hypothetical protein
MSSPTYHTGLWVNWSKSSLKKKKSSKAKPQQGKGNVLGSTLTMPRSQGNVVIAFLALFVAFSGSHLWQLICFTIHQTLATRRETDGVHQQIQTILPTGLTDMAMLWRFSKVSLAWRGKTKKLWIRMFPLLGVCLLHFGLVTVAGLFASRVTHSNDQVLLSLSSTCGWYYTKLLFGVSVSANISRNEVNAIDSLAFTSHVGLAESQQYSKRCYSWLDGSEPDLSSSTCSHYVVTSLPSSMNSTRPCPFADQACNGTAISFDSGWIDSNVHLGINAPEKNSIQIRRNMTCAPIPLEQRYSLPWTQKPSSPETLIKSYVLGRSLMYPLEGNITYSIDNMSLPMAGPNDPR